jgi:hypothetical protein
MSRHSPALVLFHESLDLQPELAIPGPWVRIGKWRFVGQSDSMLALLVDMEIKGNARFP